MANWWMVRAGDNNELIPDWLEHNVASIGWHELGDTRAFRTRDQLLEKCQTVYHGEKPGAIVAWGSQVWKFSREIQVGDRVVTYSRDSREYLVATVTQTHQYDPTVVSDHYPNIIYVKWESKRILRDVLSQGAKNTLGGILTVFRIDQWGDEILNLLNGASAVPNVTAHDEDEEESNEWIVQQASTLVEDKIANLNPWEMQDIVGGLLRAMGYQVRVSPKGRDGGIDILAHKDALGFEQPIIKVQVKHRRTTSSAPEIQQLLGTHPIGASSLFVSTGGFTSQAYHVAQQNGVKLLNLTDVVELVMEWYEKMPTEMKALLPLRKMYVPF